MKITRGTTYIFNIVMIKNIKIITFIRILYLYNDINDNNDVAMIIILFILTAGYFDVDNRSKSLF